MLKSKIYYLRYQITKSGNHQLVIKLPIGDFELGIGVFRILGLEISPNSKNTNPKLKIKNWLFYYQLGLSTLSSLLGMFRPSSKYVWPGQEFVSTCIHSTGAVHDGHTCTILDMVHCHFVHKSIACTQIVYGLDTLSGYQATPHKRVHYNITTPY